MRNSWSKFLSLLVVGVTGMEPSFAQQSSNSANDRTLEEIVVTANKRAENAMSVPTAISVLGGADLEREGAVQFTDYFNQVPGLSALSAGQAGHGIVSIRGISTGASQTSSTVGFYLDDVQFGSSGSLAIGGILIPDPDLFDVNRIEVLKGPQGTLYGASTLGGLIKVVRNAPVLNEFSARVGLEGNAVSGGGQGYGIRGVLNAPLSDTVAVRVNLSTRRDAGFVDNVKLGIEDENSTRVTAGRVALLYKPSDVFSAELSALVQNTKAHGINQTDLDPTTLKPTIGDLKTDENYIRPSDDLKYRVYSAKLDYDLKFATLTSVTSFGQYDDHQVTDITDNTGFGIVFPYPQQLKLDKITEELRLASPTGQTFEWLAGGFYTHEKNTWNFDIAGDTLLDGTKIPNFEFYKFVASTKFREAAVFASGTVHLNDQFSVVLGGRYSRNKQSYTYSRSGFVPGNPSTISDDSSDRVWTYAGTFQWEPVKSTMTYLRIAKGYRPGGPQVSNLTGLNLPPTYGPDTVINYELGLKSTLLDRRLEFDVAAFYIDWKDIQLLNTVTVQTPLGPARRSLIENAGKATTRGIEASARYRPISALTLGASLSYSNARLDDPAPNIGASAGERIPYSPRFSGTADADYEFLLGAQLTGRVGASVRYVGARYNYFSQDPVGNVRATMPSYAQFDVQGGVTYGTWDIALRVNNLTDKRGIIGAQSNAYQAVPPFAVANVSGVYITPRTIALTAVKSF